MWHIGQVNLDAQLWSPLKYGPALISLATLTTSYWARNFWNFWFFIRPLSCADGRLFGHFLWFVHTWPKNVLPLARWQLNKAPWGVLFEHFFVIQIEHMFQVYVWFWPFDRVTSKFVHVLRFTQMSVKWDQWGFRRFLKHFKPFWTKVRLEGQNFF